MSLAPRMELRQGQSLVMTPQLLQAIKLLQLSHMDLVAYVEAELERNPLLERDESDESGAPDPPPAGSYDAEDANDASGNAADDPEPPDPEPWLNNDMNPEPGALESALDTSFDNVFQSELPGGGTGDSGGDALPLFHHRCGAMSGRVAPSMTRRGSNAISPVKRRCASISRPNSLWRSPIRRTD